MDYEQLELNLPISTSSWEVRPANVRPLLASVSELLTRVTAGPNLSGSFASLGPDGSWRKTAQGYCQLTMDGSLETYSGAWPRRGTLCAGIAGEPLTLEHRTCAKGFLSSELWRTPDCADAAERKMRVNSRGEPMLSGQVKLWPTPTTPNGGRSVSHVEDWRSDRTAYHNGRKVHVDLNAAVKMWPTPVSSEATHGGPNQRDSAGRPSLTAAVRNWPTPTVNGNNNAAGSSQKAGDGLATAAKWPTPRANAGTGKCKHGEGGPDLQTAIWSTPTVNDSKNATLPPSQGKRSGITADLIRGGGAGSTEPRLDRDAAGLSSWLDEAARRLEAQRWPAGRGQEQFDWEPSRVAEGIPDRVTRLKMIGNACPPQQYLIGLAVIAELARRTAQEAGSWDT